MRRFITRITMLIIIIVLSSCSNINKKDVTNTKAPTSSALATSKDSIVTINNTDGKVGDDVPISRGMVAKMLALTFSDSKTIESEVPTINFKDLDKSKWYYNYANECANLGMIKGDGVNFRPDDNLTIQEAQYILDAANPSNTIKLNVDSSNEKKSISYGLWVDLYTKLLTGMASKDTIENKFNISTKDYIVLATKKQNNTLGDNYIITDNGPLKIDGMNVDAFFDNQIRVFEKNGEIICINENVSKEPTIKNAYIVKYDGQSITIFTGGVSRTFKVKNGTNKDINGNICDVQISSGVTKALVVYTVNIRDTIKSYDNKTIVFKDNTAYNFDTDFKVYSIINGDLKWKNINSLKVGTEIVRFVKKGNVIICGIIDKEDTPVSMRVAINTTGFAGLVHKNVSFTCTTPFAIISKKGTKSYKNGDIVNISSSENSDLFGSDIITVVPSNGGKVTLLSIKRNWANNESPSYRGTMDISKKDGGFSIVNEVLMPEYLYAVVPSEMPSSYGEKSAEVQALAARSYAYNQYYANSLHDIGANVDDSTQFQVYNNIPENKTSISAVDATKGQCITYNGTVINAYFFSTSGGTTANSGEVWDSLGEKFPLATPTFLQSEVQIKKGNFGDLSNEDNAKKFFMDTKVSAYEQKEPWFRWNVVMTNSEISTSINNNLSKLYATRPYEILTKQKDGTYKSVPTKSIGLLKTMKVLKRGVGGNIIEMEIVGTENTIHVLTEYNIRMLIKPYQYNKDKKPIILNRNGDTLKNYSLMPSSFFTMNITYDKNKNITEVHFFGGGNGHGVGLSQNGAHNMIVSGISVPDVIKHYYTGCEISKKI